MRLKSFRRGPLAAEGSGSGKIGLGSARPLDARCEMPNAIAPGPRVADGLADCSWMGRMEGKGASVGPDAWVAKERSSLAGWPLGDRPHTPDSPDGSRSAGHAGPFTENRGRLRVRCQSTNVHISSQQV